MTDEASDEVRAVFAETGEVLEERGESYGPPEFSLGTFEDLILVSVRGIQEREANGYPKLPRGVAGGIYMTQLKLSRLITAPEIKRDTFRDILGYTGTMIRCAFIGKRKTKP